ncbi:MAG: hypothetical protein K9H25_08520 [Rhodospirillum sp.]|nr:hypothetical protein [Rhodospirillum sp.]MCF8489531.1 hypothetical protein [Rhodospirillum sp.]MCF8502050.1 hypothetical protein [Rhodospirillum sp.]
MVFDLIVVACVGLAAAGLLLLLFRVTGRKAPKTLLLATIGLTVIVFTSWNRYTWADRIAAALPGNVEVIQRIRSESPFEPWTYLFPQESGLVILDKPETRTNADYPHKFWVQLLLIGRDEPETLTLQRIVDCASESWASVGGGIDLGADGLPRDTAWHRGGEPAYLFDAVCRGKG